MKKSILMIVGTAILASCSQNDLVEPGQTSNVTIEARSVHKSISGEVDSRAPFVGTLSETNSLTARVLTSKATGNYNGTNLHANGKMVFKGGATSSSYELSTVTETQTKFPSSSDPLYICGLYPYDTWSLSGTTASISFTGKEDIMSAPQQTTSATDVKAGTVPSLTFSHLLTKLEVKLKAKTNAASGIWGNITKIEVLKAGGAALKNAATITLTTGEPNFTGSTTFNMFGWSEDSGVASYSDTEFTGQTITETATPAAYAMVSPFTSTGTNDVTLRVSTQNKGVKEVNIDLTTYSGNTKGYAFGITLTFSVDDETIQASATVIDWKTGGDVEKEVE